MSSIQWTIQYNDNTIESGFNNLNSKAFNNPNLIFFELNYKDKIYSVDLKTGTITLNGFRIHSPFKNMNYRLIYYRIVSTSLPDGKIEENIPYIGWQVTINGKNHKIIFALTNPIKLVF